MKKHLIIPTTLAILTSIPAITIAASTIEAYQQGNSNTLTVTQSGIIDSVAAIDQNGNAIATINQVGTNSGISNTVSVVQDGIMSAPRNTTTINQKAGGNAASVYQTSLIPSAALVDPYSSSPFATVGLGHNAGGIAAGNTATALQTGTGNQLGIVQMGNNNTAELTQDSDNLSVIAQIGDANKAVVKQAIGLGINTSINDIAAVVVQLGSHDTATIIQTSLATFNAATIWQATSSRDSTARVTQSGAYNFANVKQLNTFNSAEVTQSGWGISNGAENHVTITQKGLAVSGLMDTATAMQSGGDSNTITITQYRGDGSTVNVTQEGSGNIATVIQH